VTALAQGAANWWVRTWNAGGYSPWSSAQPFTHETVVNQQRIDFVYDQQGLLISEASQGKAGDVYLNGQPLALIENNQIYYDYNDHLGTPQVITDNNKTLAWKADYDPFGKATVTTESVANNIRFPDQYYDTETGLHYNWNRYYDPFSGRYITSDPIGLAGGINTYGYVSGNPMNWFDPDGAEQTRTVGQRIISVPDGRPIEEGQTVIEPSAIGKLGEIIVDTMPIRLAQANSLMIFNILSSPRKNELVSLHLCQPDRHG